MRMGVIAGALAMTIAACGSAPATAHAQCGPSGAKTLAVNHLARVYETSGNVYGCADASGHAYLLAASQPTRPGQPRIGKVALAGVTVAYGETQMAVDTASATVTVRRLDNGRTVKSLSAMTGTMRPESFQSVDGIVVKADGAVAWIAHASSIGSRQPDTEVNRSDRRGRATLDSTAASDISALRLNGSRLSWRHGGALRTATLL